MLTIDEVAAMHGFSAPTVYGWTRQICVDGLPVLPVVKYAYRVRVHPSDAAQVPERLAMRLRRPSSFFCGEVSGL
jgi:transposase